MLERRDPATQSEGVVPGYVQTSQRWPSQPLVRRPLTRSELSGPQDLPRRLGAVRGDLAGHGDKRALGQLIHIRARVVDEDGAPVPGAVVEIWHCNAAGKYIHPNDSNDAPADPNFYGAARMVAGDSGLIELRTIKPGAYPQMFFPGDPLNESDPILQAIRDPAARARCVAQLAPTAKGPRNALVYDYQIVVRGRGANPALP
jgi:protocatechuate 3,4-dioxygenase beta subunit